MFFPFLHHCGYLLYSNCMCSLRAFLLRYRRLCNFFRSFECSRKLSSCLWPVTLVVTWYLQTLSRFTDSCIQPFFHVVPCLVRNYIVGIIAFLKASVRNAQSRCPENKYFEQKPPTHPPSLTLEKSASPRGTKH